jgi:hypothetical protein
MRFAHFLTESKACPERSRRGPHTRESYQDLVKEFSATLFGGALRNLHGENSLTRLWLLKSYRGPRLREPIRIRESARFAQDDKLRGIGSLRSG